MAFVISLVGGVVRGIMGKEQRHNDRNYLSHNPNYNSHNNYPAPYPNEYQNYSQDPHGGYQAPYTQAAMGYPQTVPCDRLQRQGHPCSCVECHNPRAGMLMTRRECRREGRRYRRAERDIRRAERRGIPIAYGPAMCAHPEFERNHRGAGLGTTARDIGFSLGNSISGRNREDGQNIRGETPRYDYLETQQRRASFDEEGLREMGEPPAYEPSSSTDRRRSVEVLVPEEKGHRSS